MPTPVSVARQCLTTEAVHALDEAVAVARRRGHGQTTSLHAISALLSFPSSILREACARARNCAYLPRLQFKALELCLSVSLDRVSSSQLSDDPPVSNSLMAAIKRSQANQRRQPENFHLYQQLSQSHNSSATVIKVELQQLILSILDDPVVSRVFSEAGFRSSEIKLAIVRPLATHLLEFPRSKVSPPIFLCNHSTGNSDPGPGRRGLSFAFPGFGGFREGGDENCRRIGDVIVKRKNPLLVGAYAPGALQSFRQCVERKITNNNNHNLPVELSGLTIFSIENDISRLITQKSDKRSLDMKLEELSLSVEQQSLGTAGVVVNYGDLKQFVNDNNNNNNTNNDDDDDGTSNAISYVVAQLTRLLQINSVKVGLIGYAAKDETYLKFVNRFPSIEKDWELHLLPIASLRQPSSSMVETYPKSSLMESFVPFAGFFSTPSDFKSPLSSFYQCAPRCHQCTEKCEQEIIALSKGGFPTSIADQYQSNLPSWLQMTEPCTNNGLDVKTKDDGMVLSARITGLQKKWDDICHRHHHNHTRPFPSSNMDQMGSQLPAVVGFPFLKDKREKDDSSSSRNANAQPMENSGANVNSVITIDLENMSASKSRSVSMVSKSKNESLPSKLWEKQSKVELESGSLRSPCSLSNSSVNDGNRTSPTSVTSVTTELGLGMCSTPTINETQKRTDRDHTESSPELSGCFSANVDFFHRTISNHPAHSSSSSRPDLNRQFDLANCKALFKALNERVGRQVEAICFISQIIAQGGMGCKNRHGKSLRRDIWFNFTGPDWCSKRKIAVAIAEIIYASKENCICADLSSQDGVIDVNTIFDRQDYGMKFRGKTLVDYVAGELCKKPLSVVFLENVDKADVQAQNILSKAIRTGKLSDSHGREVSINNAILVMTTSMKYSKILTSGKETLNYSEERILKAKSWLMQILVEPTFGNGRVGQTLTTSVSSKGTVFFNKRKLLGRNENQQDLDISEMVKRAHKSSTRNLDLNLPAEGDELVEDSDDWNLEIESPENSKSWLQDFFDQIETVVFKPFNFDTLAEKVLSDIKESFHNFFGIECLLEVESKVMEQLLAAAYMSESNIIVKDWVDKVLDRGFAEVKKRYNLTAGSIVKLVTYEDRVLEETTPGVCLPSKIILK